jgi:outer membrane lipase/esterase
VLAAVAAANGGGTAGATASATAAALFDNWVSLFNTELAARVSGNASVLLVDINATLKDQVANPRNYGLDNVTEAACPNVSGLDYSSCTATALDNSPAPAPGATNNPRAWRTHLFADSFHPSPAGHQLAYQQIRSALFNNSWQ